MSQRKPWIIPKIWEGETVFIIGGGPSLKDMDLAPLQYQRTIGTNQAFRDFPWVSVLYFGDCGFYSLVYKALNKWKGLKVTSCARVPEQGKGWPHIRRVGRSKPFGLETTKQGFIAWNGNTGASAINIAFWLGASRVVLLGFDMRPDNDNSSIHNWHNYYPKRHPKFNPYDLHMKGWPMISKDAAKAGLEIINATPNSAITQFKYIPLGDLI